MTTSTSSIPRVKPTVSTPSILKRKGEVEKLLPIESCFVPVAKVVHASLKTRDSESSKVMKSPESKESSPPLRTGFPMIQRTTRSRRACRKPAPTQMDDFSLMSITALKNLTNSNTACNRVIAKFETDAIRKEGIKNDCKPQRKVTWDK